MWFWQKYHRLVTLFSLRLICPMAADVHFYHLAKKVSARCHHCTVNLNLLIKYNN